MSGPGHACLNGPCRRAKFKSPLAIRSNIISTLGLNIEDRNSRFASGSMIVVVRAGSETTLPFSNNMLQYVHGEGKKGFPCKLDFTQNTEEI